MASLLTGGLISLFKSYRIIIYIKLMLSEVNYQGNQSKYYSIAYG